MIEPPTLVLDEKGEQTEIDGRSSSRSDGPRSLRGAHRSLPPFFRTEWRALLLVLIAMSTFMSIGYVAYQAHRLAEEMRVAVRRLEDQHRALALIRSAVPLESGSEKDLGTSPGPKTLASTRRNLESEAAAAVANNDYRKALAEYRRLAATFPDDATFPQLVRALESKLGCSKDEGTVERPCG